MAPSNATWDALKQICVSFYYLVPVDDEAGLEALILLDSTGGSVSACPAPSPVLGSQRHICHSSIDVPRQNLKCVGTDVLRSSSVLDVPYRRSFVESKPGATPEALEQSASWGLRKMAPPCPSPWIVEQNFRYVVPCCQCRTSDEPGSRSGEYFSAGSATLVSSQIHT